MTEVVTRRVVLQPPARSWLRPSILINARLLRLLIGVGLLASAAWYIYLYAFNKVSIAGVVNAPLITVVSQIDGYIAEDSVGQQTLLKAGQALFTVVDDRVDNRTAVELSGSRKAARGRLAALRATIGKLTAIKANLAQRSRNNMAAWIEHLDEKVKESTATLARARVVEQQTRDAAKRAATLMATGAISRVGFDNRSYANQRASSDVTRAAASLAVNKGDLAAARAGILMADNSWSDVPYSRQRVDEINIRLAGLT